MLRRGHQCLPSSSEIMVAKSMSNVSFDDLPFCCYKTYCSVIISHTVDDNMHKFALVFKCSNLFTTVYLQADYNIHIAYECFICSI